MPQTFILKLGGSIISPSLDCLFDFLYVKQLKSVLAEFVASGNKFFVTVGGGNLMRHYRDMAINNGITDTTGLHWIGTTVNVLNAEVVRVTMQDIADDGVYKYDDYYNQVPLTITKGVKVGGGGKPGHSGDVDSILAGEKLGAKTIISLKNIDAIYTADPKIDTNAKPIDHLTWDQYLQIIGNPTEHTPGANFPIDPIASQMAIEKGLKFIVIDGRNLENFKNVILGKNFTGTMVE